MVLETVDFGPFESEDVEIVVEHCGLCHSDLSVLNNDWSNSQCPAILGCFRISDLARSHAPNWIEPGEPVLQTVSMGAQWKQAGREANAQKKGQMTAKLVREIMVAAKLGGPDPDSNARLAAAVEKARKASVYRDTIERAIKKGSGQTDEKVNFELVTYEGFAPHKVPVVVECLTDSRNRTAPEIRNIFKAGSLGQPGSVAFFFNHLGVLEATHADPNRDAEGDAIEAGAQEIEPLEAEETPAGQKGARFLTAIKDLDHVSRALKSAGWNIISAEIRYVAKSFTEVSETARKEVADFLNALDDHEDVHRVYAALK